MSLATVVAAAMCIGVLAYALLGGADFGSGFYDLTAGGSRREPSWNIDRSQRRSGVGSQPRVADLCSGHVVDGIPEAFVATTTTLFTRSCSPLPELCCGDPALRSASMPPRRAGAAVWRGLRRIVVDDTVFLRHLAGAIACGRVPAAGYGDPSAHG